VRSTCDSCGRADEPLTEVHRLYITPESWETSAAVTRVDEVEHWCFACLTHYAHEQVETEPGDASSDT
jgi:hypothetical protein